jgi:hypothetical protein
VVPGSDGRIAGGTERIGRKGDAKAKRETGKPQAEIKSVNIFVANVTIGYILAIQKSTSKGTKVCS